MFTPAVTRESWKLDLLKATCVNNLTSTDDFVLILYYVGILRTKLSVVEKYSPDETLIKAVNMTASWFDDFQQG
jgi:hypothetical protein